MSFVNPAITIGHSLSDTFAGIAPADVVAFGVAELCGAFVGSSACHRVVASNRAA
jgi:glycerol uptake facilitator-like aquaporin